MSCGIYKIENLLNHKCYIGQSINIEHRFSKHKSAKDNFYIHRAIQKYGKENFSFEIIEECSEKELNNRENYWINFYNSLVPNGYNMILGGSNGAGYAKGKEVEQYSLIGEYLNTFSSALQASEQTGLNHSNICACCRGERNYVGIYQWRYKNSSLKLKKFKEVEIIISKKIIIQQFSKDDILIKEYPSANSAHKETGISCGNICECCNGNRKTAGGYKWKKIIKEEKKKIIREDKGEN